MMWLNVVRTALKTASVLIPIFLALLDVLEKLAQNGDE